MVHLVVFEVPAFALAERNPIEVGALRSLLVTFGVLLLAQAANCWEDTAKNSTFLSEHTTMHICFPQALHSADALLSPLFFFFLNNICSTMRQSTLQHVTISCISTVICTGKESGWIINISAWRQEGKLKRRICFGSSWNTSSPRDSSTNHFLGLYLAKHFAQPKRDFSTSVSSPIFFPLLNHEFCPFIYITLKWCFTLKSQVCWNEHTAKLGVNNGNCATNWPILLGGKIDGTNKWKRFHEKQELVWRMCHSPQAPLLQTPPCWAHHCIVWPHIFILSTYTRTEFVS